MNMTVYARLFADKSRGKGNAVLLGIKNATGNYIAIQDGDLEYDGNDYKLYAGNNVSFAKTELKL